MKDLYLGVDGGGTKTKVIIIDGEKNVLFENVSGPSSVDTVELDVTIGNIYDAVKPFLELNNNVKFKSVFLGLGGVVYESQKLQVFERLKTIEQFDTANISVNNDMYNALYSGLLLDEGIVLIAGTGMVAFGKDKLGNTGKCGGWGHKEGDLGSSYHLGQESIRHAIRAFDGRISKDEFAVDVAKEINLKEATDIINIMNDLHEKRTIVASLAPNVTRHADLGNIYALNIVENATDELALAIRGVYNQIKLENKQIVIVGSLGNFDSIFKTKLHEKIKEIDNELNIISPKIDPALAAAYAAYNL